MWIPNVYFDGYFPQITENTHNIDTDKHPVGRFPTGDKYIDKIMSRSKKNPDVEKILDTICDENFIPPEEIQTTVDKSLNELQYREKICDVYISDYIADNYRNEQIFFAKNHPYPMVAFELVKRILKHLGHRSENFLNLPAWLDDKNFPYSLIGQDVPIYPAVKKFFKFEVSLEEYYANKYLWEFRGNFRDYMREYILQCWHEKFTR